jgi:hypothetical protein
LNRTTHNISEIELRGSEDIATYSTALRDTLRGMAIELDLTAAELQKTLEHSTGTALDRTLARYKARRVARRLQRARDLIHGASVEGARFWTTYATEYQDLIHPGKRQGWKWEA